MNSTPASDGSVSDLWERSRSGARASLGFRFQAAATTAAAVFCWSGRLNGTSIVPEGLDDFSIESPSETIYVQTKSKSSSDSEFLVSDLTTYLLEPMPVAKRSNDSSEATRRVLLIDRPFRGELYESWTTSIAAQLTLFDLLRNSIERRLNQAGRSADVLSVNTLITWGSPIVAAAKEIVARRGVPLAAALTCVHNLVALVGERTDSNATRSYEQRASITVGEVENQIDATLRLIDQSAINAAVRKGLAMHMDFGTAVTEPGYYLGVATQPGHVAAGLTILRDGLIQAVISALLQSHRVIITGPSGSGKSAGALMAAFETRNALRWIQLLRCGPEDREDLLHFLSAQAPNSASPIVLYVDDAGRSDDGCFEAALDTSLAIPFVHVIACARSEDLAILPGLAHFKKIHPTLDDAFAERMWRGLKDRDSTRWASWQEPLERSAGLLLEYAHILTQGGRLQDIVSDQVNRRLIEGRDTEFEVLRLTSAAASLGANVSSALVASHLRLTNAECGRVLQRLVDEHLVRRVGDDELAGLHELRSNCILRVCLEVGPGSIADARREALTVVSSSGVRNLIAGALRRAELDEATIVAVIIDRLRRSQEPTLLIGALEGLKLSALDRDAETFKAIADRYGLSARFYFLVIIVMAVRNESYKGSKLEVLGKIRDEFAAKRSQDRRSAVLAGLDDRLLSSILRKIDSAASCFALLRALIGVEFGLKTTDMTILSEAITSGSIDEIASILAAAEDISVTFASRLIDQLGGSETLLDRLWAETPWSVRPTLSHGADGAVEVSADLLAVEGRLTSEPDAIVFDHATRALALAPEARTITSRPIQISGEPIRIEGWTPGLKRFDRGNRSSKAAITWNRLLLHAVALKFAADSTTIVMQRRKESIEIAARLLETHADRRCRGRKLASRMESELRALDLLEEILPALPFDRPEIALSASEAASLSDPTGELVNDVVAACRRIYDDSLDGYVLATDFQRISKSASSLRTYMRWSYVGGAPTSALERIERTALLLHEVSMAMSKHGGVAQSLITMPSHQTWRAGTALQMAHSRAREHALHKMELLRSQFEGIRTKSGVDGFTIARLSSQGSAQWPDCELCMLVAVPSVLAYYEWLGKEIGTVKPACGKVSSLVIAPLIDERIVAPCATRILSMGPIPDVEFAGHWAAHLKYPCFASSMLKAFEEAIENILILYASQELLGGKNLLAGEQTFLEACSKKAEAAIESLREEMRQRPMQSMADVVQFLLAINDICAGRENKLAIEMSATELAKQLLPSFAPVELTDLRASLFGCRLALLQYDLERPPHSQAAAEPTLT